MTCDGIGTITDYMSTSPNIDPLPVMASIAKGMEYLHGKELFKHIAHWLIPTLDCNIVHGDLKAVSVLPDNFSPAYPARPG